MIQNDYFQITPIPSEVAYFLSDAAKFRYDEVNEKTGKVVVKEKLIRDKTKLNRYYFNYPPEWKTANVGENIVGVRSLWTMNRPREFYFNIFLRKYKKEKFYEAYKKLYPKNERLSDKEMHKIVLGMSDRTIQQVINKMENKDIIVFPFNIYISLRSKDNFNDMWNIINETLATQTDLKHVIKDFVISTDKIEVEEGETIIEKRLKYIKALNKYNDNDELLFNYDRDLWFNQQITNVHNLFGAKKDVSILETNDNNELSEIFYSPCNINPTDPYYVDMLFVNDNDTYDKKYQKIKTNLEDQLDPDLPPFFANDLYLGKSRDDPEPLTKDDEFNHHFNVMFNVGDEPSQNSLDYITTYHRMLSFRNIYNRETLKIHASFGNPSNNFYIGNSHVYFDPIKYYKLNSKDDKFWIEFYSGRHSSCPVNIPEDEGFILEMLFMQNQKLLYT